ncbi:unnamed protein product [Ascophyllum nodosum]
MRREQRRRLSNNGLLNIRELGRLTAKTLHGSAKTRQTFRAG